MGEIEQFGSNLTRQFIDDHTIVIITTDGTNRQTVDDWYDLIMSTVEEWDTSQPYMAIYNLSKSGITPYSRSRSRDLIRETGRMLRDKGIRQALAIVLDSGVIGTLVRIFAQREIERKYPERPIAYFNDLEQAVTWVRNLRDESKSPS